MADRGPVRRVLSLLTTRSPGASLRRLHGWLLGRQVGVWYHPSYRIPLSGVLSSIGMSPRRADDALTWLLDRGILGHPDVREARKVAWVDVERVHPAEWIEQLDRPGTLARVIGIDMGAALPVSALLEMWRRATGGTVEAARWAVRSRSVAANLMGGFHHAFPERGIGFCPINDVAIAVRRLRHEGYRGRIGILDLDAHPPDGIAAALGDDPDVSIASLGARSGWEAGAGVLDRRLPRGASDLEYLAALDALLAELRPQDLTFYLAGADPLAGDRFGGLGTTAAGLRQRDRKVLTWLGNRPAVILPAGGYTEGAWAILAGTVAEAAGSSEVVSPTYDPVRRRTLDIARTLDPQRLKGELELNLQDVVAELGGAPVTERRFLGTYTQHGLEYALERYGFIPALKRMGFIDQRLELTSDEMPHRLRVTAEVEGRREVLVDLSLSIQGIEGWKVLFIEWLELRDPRAIFAPDPMRFGTDRHRLPGQQRPGLGLASEAGHLLLRAAERLALDAVALVPAWYHVAWMGRHDFQALDPEHQGRFEALMERLEGVPLHQATAVLHDPGLQTPDGPVRWEPVHMVRPVSEELTRALEAHQPEVDAARDRWRARLAAATLPPV